MQPEERQQRIEEYLLQVEFASLDELSEQVDASTSTVRRDLQILESKGVLRRTHGGARLANPKSDEFAFSARDTQHSLEKESIGQACTALIQPGQTVILDAGSTVFHVAKHLEQKAPQVFTNSLPVANLYAPNPRLEVVLSGGVIYPRLGVLVGPLAVESFSKIHVDVAIMSSGGVDAEGISNSHGLLIDIQRQMIRAANRVIFCLDHSKLGRRSLSPLCSLEEVDVIVTDSQAAADPVAMLKQRGIQVVVAPALGKAAAEPA
ncbi:MAG: DeoR/GlpR transcriptional regulator [Verrucomicrobia bacterium]|nr:DeoR/GlpR transcriptional regulator [Verrucomicrobiota bacterium]